MKVKADSLAEKVKTYIIRHNMLVPGSRVVVGVSGGPDSMCLLHILHRLRDELKLTLLAVHINHGLRGQEADADQLYVTGWCEKNNIDFQAVVINVDKYASENRLSTEEAARELRYAEFRRIAGALAEGKVVSRNAQNVSQNTQNVSQSAAVRIAVAHNLNDQAETILMRVFRGTGLDGLTGMEPVNGNIIRPLLETSREEIENYCLQNGIETRLDRTNLVSLYTRNKIRLECIPYIRENYNPSIEKALVRMASVIKEDKDYLQEEGKKAYSECLDNGPTTPQVNGISIDLEKFLGRHPAIQKRVLRLALEQVKGDLKGIEAGHIEDLQELAGFGLNGSTIHLPKDIRAEKSYRTINIYTEDNSTSTSASEAATDNLLKVPGTTVVLGGKVKIITELIDLKKDAGNNQKESIRQHPKSPVQYFDYEMISAVNENVIARNRRDGDVFCPSGMKGTKKLKDYFIDEKVPRNDRDSIPLLAVGREIIWIAGFRASEKFKVNEKTNILIRIEIK